MEILASIFDTTLSGASSLNWRASRYLDPFLHCCCNTKCDLILISTGPSSPHNFTITFYALWTTTFEVRLNGSLTQTETFSGVGNTNKVIHLPNGLRPPVLYNLDFNYTDYCRETISTAKVLVDEEIDGLSLRVTIIHYFNKFRVPSFQLSCLDFICSSTIPLC